MSSLLRSCICFACVLVAQSVVYAEDAVVDPSVANITPLETPAAAPAETVVPAATDAATLTPSEQATIEPTNVTEPTSTAAPVTENTSMAVPEKATDVLKANTGDATTEKNIEAVFNRNRTYSLAKKGSYSANWDIDYSYYRDTRLDLATADDASTLTRLRVEEDAQHTIINTVDVAYGWRDNMTFGFSVPLVAKADYLTDRSTVGLGDVGFNMRWEPFPLETGKLPLTLFGSLSTKTGDSPYEIPANESLSTGKGYYSVSGGASTRRYVDPVVLFASASLGYGLPVSGLNQRRGTRTLEAFDPGISGGFSMGFAYSLNYDVSLTMSYQQSFSVASQFEFSDGGVSQAGLQSSASLNISMGLRISPQTLLSTTVGIGLTEDAPDVSLGVSIPLDFTGFGREVK